MSIEEVKVNWLHYIDVCNQRDIAQMERLTDEYMAKDCIFHAPGEGDFEQGTAGQKAAMREWITKNPDFHITLDEILMVGDKMSTRATYQTNNPTTGAVESNVGLEIDRFVDGKMVESWFLIVPGKW